MKQRPPLMPIHRLEHCIMLESTQLSNKEVMPPSDRYPRMIAYPMSSVKSIDYR